MRFEFFCEFKDFFVVGKILLVFGKVIYFGFFFKLKFEVFLKEKVRIFKVIVEINFKIF